MKVHIEHDFLLRANRVWVVEERLDRVSIAQVEGGDLVFHEQDHGTEMEPTFVWPDAMLDAFREALRDTAPKVDQFVHDAVSREADRVDLLIAALIDRNG